MTDYKKLVEALRGKFIAYDVTGNHNSAQLYKDAADAIEELQQIADHYEQSAKDWWQEAREYKIKSAEGLTAEESKEIIKRFKSIPCGQIEQLPKRGEWNNNEVACLLAEMFGDDCACNLNGIDEWLPQYCEFAETCCPNPGGVACWEQFLKHRAKMEVHDG